MLRNNDWRIPWTKYVRAAFPTILLLSLSAPAWGQYQVQQTGQLVDANPQLGGVGYNYARPASPLIGGNAIASGSIGRGMSLHSFSPIQSPTAFRADLPSATLSGFRRDSVSVSDVSIPYGGLLARPYYDPSSTVPSTGFLQGLYRPHTDALGAYSRRSSAGGALDPTAAGSPVDLRLDTRLDRGVDAMLAQIGGVSPGGQRALASTLFGVEPVRTEALSPTTAYDAYLPGPVTETSAQTFLRAMQPQRPGALLDQEPKPPADLTTPQALAGEETSARPETTLEALLRGEPAAVLLQDPIRRFQLPEATPSGQPGLTSPGYARLDRATGAIVTRTGPEVPVAIHDLTVLPGYDVFNDMQLALAMSDEFGRTWYDDMREAIKENSATVPELLEMADVQSSDFVAQVKDMPIRTFVGRGASAFNNEMLKAESLVEIGRYYEAADRYEVARVLSPSNPLPMVGKGHALLAAGDYLSAAVNLLAGIERFPELARFRIDLQSLLGGGEIVDIRRSDLLHRLENREDPQLRFLLGYLEYFGGHQESGLANLEQAAADPNATPIMRAYPAMLKGEGAAPPPHLPETPLVLPPAAEPATAPAPVPENRAAPPGGAAE